MVDFPDSAEAVAAVADKRAAHLRKYTTEVSDKIIEMSLLPPVEYDRARKEAAMAMGVRPSTLDAEVRETKRAGAHAEESDPIFSDDDLALRFSDKYASDLRYTAKFGVWNEWVGSHWKADETLHVFTKARQICREAAQMVAPEQAPRLASSMTVAAVERMARNDRRHAVTADQWDADLWILATPLGTVDLKTGLLRPAKPEEHCTKITSVSPGGACPLWLDFLETITSGNTELQAFLQRIAGYALTGITTEQALFFFYGTGGNGKGVFLNLLSSIFGDYATIAGMDTFTASQSERHSTDLAMLRGARLTVSQESEEGSAWAEARIKALTGGDPITARFMRQDFFTYQPQFKLIIAGNHKPTLRNVDAAIRRRFHLVPFTVTIPKESRDPELPEKLKAEAAGILQWAIDGCLSWQAIGLSPPAIVAAATEEYLDAEDVLANWIADRCEIDRTYSEESSALFRDYSAWTIAAGEKPGTQKSFSQAMLTRGFTKAPKTRHATLQGVRLYVSRVAHHERPDEWA